MESVNLNSVTEPCIDGFATNTREPLIKSWMNSLSPARIVNRWPIAALASTCNRITHALIPTLGRLALENSESQSVSPRLNQRFPRLFVLMLITLILLLPLAVQSDELFDSQMKLAKKGDNEAQYKVGEMYETGFGVKQNKREAKYWITRSANQGYETAVFKLLYWDVEKKGLKGKNKTRVEELNKKAEQGNAQAQYYLGKMYAHGVGINKNPDIAIGWLNKAALVGVLEAERELVSVREEKQREALKKGEVKKKPRKQQFESDPCKSKSAKFLSTCR